MEKRACLKLFTKYASLNVLGMIGLSCYILADTFFVSKGLGVNGLTALNLAIPVYSFIHGCGLMFGMGGATKYSIFKSQGKTQDADRAFTNTLILSSGFALTFLLIGVFFSGAITRMLGADEAVFDMSKTYLQVILLFAPMFMLNEVLLCFVRNDGAPHLSMAAMVAGSLSNVVLDYVFIFPLNMGIFGAVLATGIAPIISILILSPFFIRRKNQFHIVRRAPSPRLTGQIFSSGLPSLITEVSSGIVMIIFNTILLNLQGNTAVAAYGIIANLSLVVIAIYTGIAQGIQPITSSSHGTGDAGTIKLILRYAVTATLVISGIIYFIVYFGTTQIVNIFNSERNIMLQSMAEKGLKIYFTACAFAGLNIIMSMYFTSTERVRPANTISLLRGFMVIIPMTLILSSLGGVTGVWFSFPATELIVCILGAVLLYFSNRRHHINNSVCNDAGNSI